MSYFLGLFTGFFLGWCAFAPIPAHSEEHTGHPAQDMPLHEQFYSKWMMPEPRDAMNHRSISCCDKKDCYPTTIRKVNSDVYEAHRRERDQRPGVSEWIRFPATLLEQNQEDEQESPDGQSHACIAEWSDLVYCATIGSGM